MSATLTPTSTQEAGALASAPAIVVDAVSKTFRLPHRRYSTLKERVLHPFRSSVYDELRAVEDFSLEVGCGEFFGIVGRNGSGKSTLLKCLAGIYRPDSGEILIDGRLSPFIELGVGFNPDLTARDNVTLNAIMLGLTRRQARERFDEIIAFAELEKFIDLPLKNYSSGMSVRLAFSVTVEVDADILLIDEVLAVGDAAFQQKCFEQFEHLKRAGKTIVLVTHDMSAVERFCDRALLMDRGRILALGEAHEIALAYNELNFGRLVSPEAEGAERYGDHAAAEIKAAWFETDAGERITAMAQGEPCTMCTDVLFLARVAAPIFAFHLRNEPRHTVFAASSDWRTERFGSFEAGETAQVRVRFENWLAPNRYTMSPSVARSGPGADVLDLREDLAAVVVHGTRVTGGIADVPHDFTVERA
ncbi:MAG: ABC transporter ATP-binding protein [Actinomycetota bacterium]|nr:ABC transporter ATP-binding protein [Actinomycetota bacterium]